MHHGNPSRTDAHLGALRGQRLAAAGILFSETVLIFSRSGSRPQFLRLYLRSPFQLLARSRIIEIGDPDIRAWLRGLAGQVLDRVIYLPGHSCTLVFSDLWILRVDISGTRGLGMEFKYPDMKVYI